MPLETWIFAETTMIDSFFLLAAGALGWGLSLATYRLFAARNHWPMGQLHVDVPLIPVPIGAGAIAVGLVFSAARGSEYGGWYIIGLGVLLAFFWTGFLRVGSQISLFLAPAAAAVLVLGFLGFPFPGNYDIVPTGYKSRVTSSFPIDRIEDRTLSTTQPKR
jgi:hypothetical protein